MRQFFSDLFTSSNPSIDEISSLTNHIFRALDAEAFQTLDQEFSIEEIKAVVFEQGPLKALGPNGF